MTLRRLASTVILGVTAAGVAAAGTLAPALETQLQTAQAHEMIKCLVVLKGQSDVVGLDKGMSGQGIVLTATPAKNREIALRDDVEIIEPTMVPELIKPVEV